MLTLTDDVIAKQIPGADTDAAEASRATIRTKYASDADKHRSLLATTADFCLTGSRCAGGAVIFGDVIETRNSSAQLRLAEIDMQAEISR